MPAPFIHCTTEHGRMFVPVTVKVAPAAPAVAVVGEMDAIVGGGSDEAEIAKGSVLESTPELDTRIFTVPTGAMSEAVTVAVSCVELTNVVARVDGSAGGGLITH